MNSKLESIFLYNLINCNNSIIDKEEIVNVAEELSIDNISNKLSRTKLVNKIATSEENIDKLYHYFSERLYIPIWIVADFYNTSSKAIEILDKLNIITEDSKEEEFWSRSHREYYTAKTYQISILENYNEDYLKEKYELANCSNGYKVRVEVSSEEDKDKFVEQLEKVFKINNLDMYNRISDEYYAYMTVNIINNSDIEKSYERLQISEMKAMYDKDIKKLTERYTRTIEKIKSTVASDLHIEKFNRYEIISIREELYKLRKENEELKQQLASRVKRIHNERGGGRKNKFSEEEEKRIIQLRESGMTLQKIAEELQCSVSLVHKVLKRNK